MPVNQTASLIRSERHVKAARARWGDPRILRLDDLTPEQRRLVVALVDAAKEAAPVPTETAQEVTRASATTPTR